MEHLKNPRRSRWWRWALKRQLIAIAALAAGLAVLAPFFRTQPRMFRDPKLLAFISESNEVQLFRLAPIDNYLDLDDESTHDSYAVAMGPVSIAEADRVRLIEMLTDEQNWYTPNTPVFNTVPNYYEYRLRFKRAGDVLDFDLGWHATAFFNNRIVAGDAWSLNGRDRMFALLESVIASKSPPSRPAAATR